MRRTTKVGATAWIPAMALVALPAMGQEWCDRGGEGERYCEERTPAVGDFRGSLEIDGGGNGGVMVEAWSGSTVEVLAKVWARADDETRAREIASEIEIRTDGARLRADGPRTGRGEGWGVSWEVRVPVDTDLDIETVNGGIEIAAVRGDIEFQAVNGGVHLDGLSGDVKGSTVNGGVHVRLTGDRWNGAGLEVQTVNGGVHVEVPDDYSAELMTGTMNGGIDFDFPVTVQGRIGRRVEATLGSGGAPVRVTTTNGGVRVSRS